LFKCLEGSTFFKGVRHAAGLDRIADYYLVAHALAHGHTVVTHEAVSASTKKIKIPNACIGLNIKSITPYEMLRIERARFILGPKA
jgi:hypothetical protein